MPHGSNTGTSQLKNKVKEKQSSEQGFKTYVTYVVI